MFGVWQWSVLLWCLGTGFWQTSAAIARNNSRDEVPSLKSKTITGAAATAPNGVIIVGSPFDDKLEQHYSVVTSEIWSNLSSSGRRLRQADQIFQQNYWLVGCHASAPNAAAAQLKDLITQVRLNIRLVILEAQKGVASQFGFRAFFKTNDNISRVIEIFKKIANGDKIKHHKANQRKSWHTSWKGHPVIGCAFTPKDKVNPEVYQMCQSPPRYAYQPIGSKWTFLCPSFWNAMEAPSFSQCPDIHANGSLANPADLQLHMSQQAIFVHEMVHMYLGLHIQSEIVEHYTLSAVMELSAEEAVENASNYGYFYSGKSDAQALTTLLDFSAAVIAACLHWPYGVAGINGEDGGL